MVKQSSKKLVVILLLFAMVCIELMPFGFFVLDVKGAAGDFYYAVNGNGTIEPYKITHVSTDGADLTITQNDRVYEISGNSGDHSSPGRITVSSGVNTTLVLTGVTRTSLAGNPGALASFNYNMGPPLYIDAGANVTLVLADGTVNTFTCQGYGTATGSPQAGIFVHPAATLTIKGEAANTGELIANGGAYSAGIGGGANTANGTITIEGGIITATSYNPSSPPSSSHGAGAYNGAGIGGGGGNSVDVLTGSESAGNITICGNAVVTATSHGNGAGIGGGGNGSALATTGGATTIYGNAIVTATSYGNGAGIGGGGTTSSSASTKTSGSGGTISISENTTVIATSHGNGAGIGGGGTQSGIAGAGGTISIYDDASITANSNRNGAGIGGGGADSSATANLGASGTISISGQPTIIADSTSGKDIGPGENTANNSGTAESITILGGAVYADNTAPIKNGSSNNDILTMVTITDAANKALEFFASGSSSDYTYKATTNASGNAYLWLPLSNQIIICKEMNTSGAIIGYGIAVLSAPSTEVAAPLIPGYTHIPPLSTILWDGSSATSTIEYYYAGEPPVVVLIAYDSVTGTQLGSPVYTHEVPVGNLPLATVPYYYQYSAEIPDLTLLVDAGEPGLYTLTPDDSTITHVTGTGASSPNEVKIYYTPVSTGTTVLPPPTIIAAPPMAPPTLSPTPQPTMQPTPAPSSSSAPSPTTSSRPASNRPVATSDPTSVLQSISMIDMPDDDPANEGYAVPAKLTITCIDETNKKLYIQPLTSVVGSFETINAPPLEGYGLLTNEASNQVVKIVAGDNVITFQYAKLKEALDDSTPHSESPSYLWWLLLAIAFIGGAVVMCFIFLTPKKPKEQQAWN